MGICSTCGKVSIPTGEKGDTGAAGSGEVLGVVTVNTATSNFVAGDTGSLVLLDRDAGSAMTLPTAPPEGTYYDVQIKTENTGGDYTITTGGSDVLLGYVAANQSGAIPLNYNAADIGVDATVFTLDGSTKGGLVGTDVRFVYDGAGTWWVSGSTETSGTRATPFSA